jgi:hypothetical protein
MYSTSKRMLAGFITSAVFVSSDVEMFPSLASALHFLFLLFLHATLNYRGSLQPKNHM